MNIKRIICYDRDRNPLSLRRIPMIGNFSLTHVFWSANNATDPDDFLAKMRLALKEEISLLQTSSRFVLYGVVDYDGNEVYLKLEYPCESSNETNV